MTTKKNTINLETLDNKTLRATYCIEGRTIEYFEGSNGAELVQKALKRGGFIFNGKIDFKYLELNAAAFSTIAALLS